MQGASSRRRRKTSPDGEAAIAGSIPETDEERAKRRRARKRAKQKALAQAEAQAGARAEAGSDGEAPRKKRRKKKRSDAEGPGVDGSARAEAEVGSSGGTESSGARKKKRRRKKAAEASGAAETAEKPPSSDERTRTKRRRKRSEAEGDTSGGADGEDTEKKRRKKRRRKSEAELAERHASTGKDVEDGAEAGTDESGEKRRRKRRDGESRRVRRSKREKSSRKEDRAERELEEVALDGAPETAAVARVGKKRLAPRPNEQEEALSAIEAPPAALDNIEALEGEEDFEPTPFEDGSFGESLFADEIEAEEGIIEESAEELVAIERVPAPQPTSEVLLDLDQDDDEDDDDDRRRRDERRKTGRGQTSRRRRETSRRRREELDEDGLPLPEKKAHPLFIAAIIGVPLVGVLVMGYFKFIKPAGTGSGSSYVAGDDGDTTGGGEPQVTGVMANWLEALELAADVVSRTRVLGQKMDALEDRASGGGDISSEREALAAQMADLDRELDTMLDAGKEVIAHYKEQWGLQEEAAVIKRIDQSNPKVQLGPKMRDLRGFKRDLKTKIDNLKQLGN